MKISILLVLLLAVIAMCLALPCPSCSGGDHSPPKTVVKRNSADDAKHGSRAKFPSFTKYASRAVGKPVDNQKGN
ncbi:hypothetical protein Ddc_14909 [Ditylenchus destructor]|nr:hypothetical protein Ddc_14909 [Ditylenchus destructor]